MPQSVEEFVGMAVNSSCSADGFPVPNIMWYYQGMISEIVSNTDSTYIKSTLVITDLMLSNGGDYACETSSMANVMPSNMTATVAVIESKMNYIQVIILYVTYYMSGCSDCTSTIS